jgi:hypothetical protein
MCRSNFQDFICLEKCSGAFRNIERGRGGDNHLRRFFYKDGDQISEPKILTTFFSHYSFFPSSPLARVAKGGGGAGGRTTGALKIVEPVVQRYHPHRKKNFPAPRGRSPERPPPQIRHCTKTATTKFG